MAGLLECVGITSQTTGAGLSRLADMPTDGLPGSSLKQSSPDRRREARTPVVQDALVHFRNGKSWVCTIRDFCSAGMFIKGDAGALRKSMGDVDDVGSLEIHFTASDAKGRSRHFQVVGKAVRHLDDAVGVHFTTGLDKEILAALATRAVVDTSVRRDERNYAPSVGEGGQSFDSAKGRKLAIACSKAAEAAMGKLADEFFALFDDELDGCERRASSMQERESFGLAKRLLPRVNKEIRSRFVDWIVELLRQQKVPSGPAMSDSAKSAHGEAVAVTSVKGLRFATASNLTLVEKEEFEQWLVVAETVSYIEQELQDEILVLRAWLEKLQPAWKNKDANPVCPAVVARSLKQALMPLQLREEVIRVAFGCFARIAQSRLGAFYDKLISSLEKTGLFPSIESVINDQLRQHVPSSPSRVWSSQAPAGSAAQQQGEDDARFHDGSQRSHAATSSVGRILQLGRDAHQPDSGSTHAAVDVDTVLKLLATLQNKAAIAGDQLGDVDLKTLLIQQLSAARGGAVQLPARTEASLDAVDFFVESVQEDELLSRSLRNLVRRLEITLGKEVLRNLESNADGLLPHPALQILHQLEGVDGGDNDQQENQSVAGDQVATILTRLMNDWDGNTHAFEDAVQQMTPLVERQKKIYARNVERVISGCEGRSRLRRARQVVLRRFVELLDGHEVPSLLIQIINPSWRNLLVNTALRQGVRSIEWKQQLQVLQRLVHRLDPQTRDKYVNTTEDGSAEVLVRCLADGLVSIGANPDAALLDRLRILLAGGVDQEQLVRIEPGQLARLFGWLDSSQSHDPMPPTRDDRERARWLDNLRRARVLQTGTSVKFVASDNSPQIAILAWVDSAGEHFVFVNRRGLQSHELSLGDLTDALHSGAMTILDGYDASLVDRVSDRMVHRAHTRVTAGTQQDELTQLANRKAHERSVDKALDLARQSDSTHCVLQIDLDRFRMFNSAVGFDGGDQLLKRIARLIEESIEGLDASIARIGADEFGVVLLDTDITQGVILADTILAAVREITISWKGQQNGVTATIGVLGIDRGTEDTRHVLNNLAAACRRGKELGGDRTCSCTEDDEAIRTEREVMQLASQIEKHLADGRVRLNVQLIAPADGNLAMLPHHEVLITFTDDEGNTGSPVKFIEAAERHSKMPLVDRFVVSGVLDWMGKHPEALDGTSGFSINLSGQSMIQEDFLSFVLDRFEKSGASPQKVCFEITETAAIGNMFRAVEFMQKFKVMGCRFSLDDFGSGMSSYGYLRKLPVDYLKIDGSFVKNMATDEGDRAVVRSINEIGHFLGKKTVAEYVHDDATRQLACEIGVDYLQGWAIEKPKPIDLLLDSTSAVVSQAS
jgi:diguanylate cyclase (GGDEF)-like protein